MKRLSLFVLALIMLIPMGCGSKLEQKGINLSIQIVPERLSDNLFVKMNYNTELTGEFSSIGSDMSMFVHFWRKKTKEMIVQDDHMPVKPTSSWKPGDTMTESRIVFIPRFFNEYAFDYKKDETIRLTIGLVDPKKPDQGVILLQKDLMIESASDVAPAIFHDVGWHQPEVNSKADNPEETKWRWTMQKAVCIIENPRKTCDLRINGGVNKTYLPDQGITIKINDTVLEQFIPETSKFSKIYTITPEMVGDLDEFQLTIETDKTFIPSLVSPDSKDERELGVQVYFLYFRDSIQ
mgnify:CR=1 FL=1